MDSNETSSSNAQRSRAAWVVSAAALVLAVGGVWLLSRTTNALAPSVGVPAASAPGALESPRTEVKAEAAAEPLPIASAVPTPIPHPQGAMPTSSFAEELRKVQLTLQGHGTPKEMLEAATMLSACEGMDSVMEGTYRARDQNDPAFRRANSSAGVSSEQAIKHMEEVRRRCQVFDSATLARRGELLKGAYEGGAEGSALPYLVWINASQQAINPELRGKLQRDARQTAEDGDRLALAQFSFPFSTAHLGITEVQRQAYREAGLRITGEASDAEAEKSSRVMSDNTEKMMAQWGRMPPPLSPQKQREADALAAKVVDAWRKRQAKGG